MERLQREKPKAELAEFSGETRGQPLLCTLLWRPLHCPPRILLSWLGTAFSHVLDCCFASMFMILPGTQVRYKQSVLDIHSAFNHHQTGNTHLWNKNRLFCSCFLPSHSSSFLSLCPTLPRPLFSPSLYDMYWPRLYIILQAV